MLSFQLIVEDNQISPVKISRLLYKQDWWWIIFWSVPQNAQIHCWNYWHYFWCTFHNDVSYFIWVLFSIFQALCRLPHSCNNTCHFLSGSDKETHYPSNILFKRHFHLPLPKILNNHCWQYWAWWTSGLPHYKLSSYVGMYCDHKNLDLLCIICVYANIWIPKACSVPSLSLTTCSLPSLLLGQQLDIDCAGIWHTVLEIRDTSWVALPL